MTRWAVRAASVLVVLGLALTGCSPGEAASGAPADSRLLSAAGSGDLAAAKAAVAAGAALEAVDDRGRTPLVRAAYGNHVELAGYLVGLGADVNHKDDTVQSPYLIATAEVGDDPRLLDLFLTHGARVNDLDSWNGTGLIRAADRGYPQVVARLIAAGIDLDHVNRLGWTALLEAVILGGGDAAHREVVQLLLRAGADPTIADRDGVTPAEHARSRGYTEIAALFR